MLNFIASFESIFGLPAVFGYIFVFAFGAVVGSFLNVVIHRIPNEESIVFPNSACPKCHKNILFYDNIPILSWLILGGRCRNCREKISPRYPAVEILTALVFISVYWQIGLNAFLPVALIFSASIIALIFIDAEHYILPNVITYPLLIFSLLIRIFFPIFISAEFFTDLHHSPLLYLNNLPIWLISFIGAIFGGLVGGGFLWTVGELWKRLRGVEAMGLGDVKMMFAVGRAARLAFDFSFNFFGRVQRSFGRNNFDVRAKGCKFSDSNSVRHFSRHRLARRTAFRRTNHQLVFPDIFSLLIPHIFFQTGG